jgi:hypothetical protein
MWFAFAGCADAGELDMLIEELKICKMMKILKYTNYQLRLKYYQTMFLHKTKKT